MIKLKDIILEIKKGTKLPVFPILEEIERLKISKMEEAEAVNFIKIILIPRVTEKFNQINPYTFLIGKDGEWIKRDTGLRIKPSDISQVLKKTRQSWGLRHDKNIEVITYTSDIQLTQRKKGHNKHHIFDFYIYKNRQSGKIHIESNVHLSNYGNMIYIMGRPLTESVIPDRFKVSKKEEAEAVSFIKKVGIPHAVKSWNKDWTQYDPLTEDNIRQSLRKFAHIGNIITYITKFQVPSISPHNRDHYFVYRIYKSDSVNKLTKLTVELITNRHAAGDRTWEI